MRQGFYEVLVCPTNNPAKPFEETIIDGKTYVHAEPGEYKINVRVAPEFHHLVHSKLLCGKVEIDGEAAHCYTALTAADKQTCLQGCLDRFYKPNKIIFFAFKQPATVEADEDGSGDGEEEERQKLGMIKVTIHECELRSAAGVTFTSAGELKEPRTVEGGKKFWKQPSLLTGGGRIAERPPSTASSYYHILREIFTIELFYHTAGTIRILANIAEQGEHPTESSSSSSSSAAAAGKKRRRVDNEIIDLTLE